jgi:hypothetical protein
MPKATQVTLSHQNRPGMLAYIAKVHAFRILHAMESVMGWAVFRPVPSHKWIR